MSQDIGYLVGACATGLYADQFGQDFTFASLSALLMANVALFARNWVKLKAAKELAQKAASVGKAAGGATGKSVVSKAQGQNGVNANTTSVSNSVNSGNPVGRTGAGSPGGSANNRTSSTASGPTSESGSSSEKGSNLSVKRVSEVVATKLSKLKERAGEEIRKRKP
jgi:hypothetical protein